MQENHIDGKGLFHKAVDQGQIGLLPSTAGLEVKELARQDDAPPFSDGCEPLP